MFHVAVSRNGPVTLFASAMSGGVFRSVDAGASWQEVDSGLPGDAFCELVIDPRVTRVCVCRVRRDGIQDRPTAEAAGRR